MAALPLNTRFADFLVYPPDENEFSRQGRITAAKIDGYRQPAFNAELAQTYWRDLVVNITGVTLGEDTSAHNRIWYQVNGESYVHSGDVQPVEQHIQPPQPILPAQKVLAQVSVPFTDAVWDIRRPDRIAYRLYFATTYWIDNAVQDEQGAYWYHIGDDKWNIFYYVKAAHLRILPAEDLSPLSPDVPPDLKRIEIHLPEQLVIAYEDTTPVFMARVSTGAQFRDGDYRTPAGTYITNRKRPSRHMAAGDRAASNSYDLPGVPWVSYLMDNGISFHGTYWHNNYGQPRSHGCINLTPQDALWIYRWTTPVVPLGSTTIDEKTGTMVHVVDQPIG